jgi:hypothetical protein
MSIIVNLRILGLSHGVAAMISLIRVSIPSTGHTGGGRPDGLGGAGGFRR